MIYWWHIPDLGIEQGEDGVDLLYPAVRLLFKARFPTYTDGPTSVWATRTNTEVIGRVTLKLSGLGGSRLSAKRLGTGGDLFLVDAGAHVWCLGMPTTFLEWML